MSNVDLLENTVIPTSSGLLTAELKVVEKIEAGTLILNLPDGQQKQFLGKSHGPRATITIKNPAFFSRLVKAGEIGFAEMYMDEWWDTPDLQAVLDLVVLNSAAIRAGLGANWFVNLLDDIRHWLRSNTKRQARKNISYHYDLGNDFYSLWLDRSMTYSSGLYLGADDTLAQAQTQKYDAILNSIDPNENSKLLEIGCGWGGFAEIAAKERGAHVTGLTISREQYDFARKRVFDAGLNDKVDIVLRDYRDETGTYDGIASIEMFEAVGEKHWPTYFNAVHDRLKPNARATIQTITIAESQFEKYRSRVDFIQKYIFPGGMLPSQSVLADRIEDAGLYITDTLEFGQSYSQTLREWFARFNAEWAAIEGMGYDDRFRRMWNYYLTACAASFRYETTGVVQVTLARK